MVEEAIIADDPANADRPGALSQGTYGAKVAVPLEIARTAGRRERRPSASEGKRGICILPVPNELYFFFSCRACTGRMSRHVRRFSRAWPMLE